MNFLVRVILTAALGAGMAFSQEYLSIDKAVSIALDQNRSLLSARHDVTASHWGKLNAVTNFLPKVEISSSVTRIDEQTLAMANAAVDFIKQVAGPLGIPPSMLSDLRPFAYKDTYATGVTVVQPVYNGGAEIVGLSAANALEDRSEFSFEDAEQDVTARTKIAYFTVLKAQELVALAHEAAERTKRYLDMTSRRAALGQRTQTDVLRWEVACASSQGTTITAENGLAMSRIQLNEVMGVELERQFVLEAVGRPDSAVLVASVASAVVGGGAPAAFDPGFLDAHPAMKAMDASLRLADANVEKSWVNFKPRINAAFQYGWEKNGTFALDGIRPWALALSVSYPLFNGFGDFTNMEKARYEYKRTEAQVETFRRGLMMAATNARLSLNAAQQRMETARKAQEEALEVLNSVTRRYEMGGASNVDLIDVQTAFTSAKTDYITAYYDFLIADTQLARATGTLHP
ncbi:MAG TPA: TolC family protein [Bacteroidota bacterium]|nr:TolC family protein [Bacteroidota bacterium]